MRERLDDVDDETAAAALALEDVLRRARLPATVLRTAEARFLRAAQAVLDLEIIRVQRAMRAGLRVPLPPPLDGCDLGEIAARVALGVQRDFAAGCLERVLTEPHRSNLSTGDSE